MRGVGSAFDIGEKPLCDTECGLRKNYVWPRPVHSTVEHSPGWATAVISNAEQVHHLRHAGIERLACENVIGDSQRLNFVDVIVWEVGKDATTVGGLPPKDFQRKLIAVVPRHLLCNEIINARPLVNLRQLPVVSERVGIPADANVGAELVFEIPF